MKQILFIFIAFSGLFSVCGQGKEKVYKAPSPNFIDLSLQTHNNKLRFGVQDEYYLKSDGSYVKPSDATYVDIDKRFSHNNASRHAFAELLKIRFKEEMFAAMDTDYFTERTNTMFEKDKMSHTAQQHTLLLANALSTNEHAMSYFCNQKEDSDCTSRFPQAGYYNEPSNIRPWGGRGATDFQQLRAYTTFAKNDLPVIVKWGSTLLPDNTLNGYYVTRTHLGKYDFKAGGFWLITHQFYNQGFLLKWYGLQPGNSAERKLMHPNGASILLKMSPDKAETFSEKVQQIHLVFNVTGKLNGLESYRADQLKTTFTLNSPIIEIYSDDSLTNKVDEIDINTMVTKTR